MKFCTNCGAQLSDETKFCSNCGQKQEVAAPAAPAQNDSAPVQTYEAPVQTYEAPVQTYEAPVQTYEAPVQTYEAPVQTYTAPAQTYEAPAAPVYEAPAQTYTAPVAQTYEAPAQQSYSAPVQQSYVAPAAQPKTQPKPGFVPGKGGAGGSKKFLAIGGIAVVVVLIIVLLVSCLGGGSKADDVLGVYTGISCKLGAMEVDLTDSSLELKEDDKASLRLEGDSIPCEWALDGEVLTLSIEGYEIEGTLEDETIVLDLEGMLYTFEKGAKANAVQDGDKDATTGESVESVEGGEAMDLSGLTATVGDCTYTVVGAEHFTDYDGDDAIRVYYDFTNGTDDLIASWDNLDIAVTQDGYDIEETYVSYDEAVPESEFYCLDIYPGVTVRCVAEYKLNMSGGNIVMVFSDYWEETELFTAEFDPNNLPGAPAAFELAAVAEPSWTNDMSDEGTIGDGYYIYIDSAEIIDGYDGESLLRVYFDFGNQTSEENSMWMATNVKAFQDGVELETGYAAEECEEEENFDIDIAPGESIYTAKCFELRSESPVEIIVYDSWTEEYLGCAFELNG